MARTTFGEYLLIGVQALIVDAIIAFIIGGIFWIFSWIGFFSIGTTLFMISLIFLIPLALLGYLLLKGIFYNIFWDWDSKW